ESRPGIRSVCSSGSSAWIPQEPPAGQAWDSQSRAESPRRTEARSASNRAARREPRLLPIFRLNTPAETGGSEQGRHHCCRVEVFRRGRRWELLEHRVLRITRE